MLNKDGLSASTVSPIWKNWKTMLKNYMFENSHSNCQKIKIKNTWSSMSWLLGLLSWFKIQRSPGLSISTPILKVPARKFAPELSHKDFISSNRFIDYYKNRNNIV